jgi:hypothetical protein
MAPGKHNSNTTNKINNKYFYFKDNFTIQALDFPGDRRLACRRTPSL